MQGVLRDGENKFLARYAVDKKSRSMEFTWIDAANKDGSATIFRQELTGNDIK